MARRKGSSAKRVGAGVSAGVGVGVGLSEEEGWWRSLPPSAALPPCHQPPRPLDDVLSWLTTASPPPILQIPTALQLPDPCRHPSSSSSTSNLPRQHPRPTRQLCHRHPCCGGPCHLYNRSRPSSDGQIRGDLGKFSNSHSPSSYPLFLSLYINISS